MKIRVDGLAPSDIRVLTDEDEDITEALSIKKITMDLECGKENTVWLECYLTKAEITKAITLLKSGKNLEEIKNR